MIFKTYTYKNIFCNAKQTADNNLIIDTELVKIYEHFDEDQQNTSPSRVYEFVIRVPVDKKQAVLNDAKYFECYFDSRYKKIRF